MRLRMVFAAVAAVAVLGLLALFFRKPGALADVRPSNKVVLATSAFMLSAPVFVADREGFFRREGLAVDIVLTPTGKDSLRMMIAGHADVVTVASLPLTQAILDGEEPHIIATITKSDRDLVVVANGARGIRDAVDLRGKRVAATSGTSYDYYLDATLVDAGIRPASVIRVDARPDGALEALVKGAVDAAVLSPPFTGRAIKMLGTAAVRLTPPLYTTHWNLVASDRLMGSRPEFAEKLLRALVNAESFMMQHPDEAAADTAEWMRISRNDAAALWPNYQYHVQLPQSLVVGMEDETRWIAIGRTIKSPAMPVPNFLDYVDIEPLRKVKPEAIRITR